MNWEPVIFNGKKAVATRSPGYIARVYPVGKQWFWSIRNDTGTDVLGYAHDHGFCRTEENAIVKAEKALAVKAGAADSTQ